MLNLIKKLYNDSRIRYLFFGVNWQPREPKVTTGYLARYASMVTSGNRGAVLEIKK